MANPASASVPVEPASSLVVVQLEPGEDGPVTIDDADRPGAAVLLHSRGTAAVRYPFDAVTSSHEATCSAAGGPVVDALIGGVNISLVCCGADLASQHGMLPWHV